MFDHADRPPRRSLREWLTHLSPNQQLGYGCVGVIIAGTLVLYCSGLLSLVVRPFLFERMAETPPPIPQQLPIALPSPVPTKPLFTLIPLPQVTLPPTPTQAPLPTRERPTPTPEFSVTPGFTVTVTIVIPRGTQTATATATRR